MAQKAYVEFYEKILPSPSGADTLQKLKATSDEGEYARIAVEAGRKAGYEFTEDEVRSVMQSSVAKAKQGSGELSEAQLDTAVGGAMANASAMTVNLGTSLNIKNLGPAGGQAKIPDLGGVANQPTAMCPW